MKLGYISECNFELNPHLVGKKDRFTFKEASYSIVINSRGKKVKCKNFYGSLDFEDIEQTTKILKDNPKIMLVREPVFLDDELRIRMIKWCEWANKAKESDFDPFSKEE